MRNKEITKRAMRIANRLRDDMLLELREFLQVDYTARLMNELQEFRNDSYAGFVQGISNNVHKEREQPPAGGCLDIYEEKLYGELHIGGRVVASRYARLQQVIESMAQKDANLARVANANREDHQWLESVMPYWDDPSRTTEEVTDLYRRDHPTSEAS